MQQEIPRDRDITLQRLRRLPTVLPKKFIKRLKLKFTLSHSNLEILHSSHHNVHQN